MGWNVPLFCTQWAEVEVDERRMGATSRQPCLTTTYDLVHYDTLSNTAALCSHYVLFTITMKTGASKSIQNNNH